MTWSVALTCLAIFVARIGDVSIGTVRTIMIVQGRRLLAWGLGFFEVLIWLFAVAKVFGSLGQPVYAISYALGFASGNYVGLMVESWLSFGVQAIRIFTRRGTELAAALRADGNGVTEFEGRGRDGVVYELFVSSRRRRIPAVVRRARSIDPECFYVVQDLRLVSTATGEVPEASGWRAVLKRK